MTHSLVLVNKVFAVILLLSFDLWRQDTSLRDRYRGKPCDFIITYIKVEPLCWKDSSLDTVDGGLSSN
jgi:hypothetical protein